MKKIVSSIAVCITILSAAVFSYAADIKETPDVKIVIDGKASTYADVPISEDGHTLLPLRAILTNLGVANDDQHILWNDTEKSVTVSKDSTKIELKVNSNTADVNDSSVKLDVAPVNYKGKVYIPARFISQSLGKKVVWDGSSASVLIRDEKDFNSVKEILDKSTKAMEKVSKLKLTMDATVDTSISGVSVNAVVKGTGEVDKSQKIFHMSFDMNMLGQNMNMNAYMTQNGMFMQNSSTNTWQKVPVTKEQIDKCFASNGNTINLEASDALAAGLVADTSNADEIVLKGDVYMDELFKSMNVNNISLNNIKFNKVNVELHIDKNTYYTTKVNEDVSISLNDDKSAQSTTMNEKISCAFSDYNGNINISLPEGIK